MLLAMLVFILGAGAVLGGYAAVTLVPAMLASATGSSAGCMTCRRRSVVDAADADRGQTADRRAAAGLDRLVVAHAGRDRGWPTLIEQSGVPDDAERDHPDDARPSAAAAASPRGSSRRQWYAASWRPSSAGAAADRCSCRTADRSALTAFEEQFPEALDLLSRALRAGHAFQTAMGMVADELKAPVGPEFKKTFDQQNFGLPLRDALTR